MAGGEHHEPVGVPDVAGAGGAGRVQRLPGDHHAHHRRLAGAGGHLGAQPHHAVVVLAGLVFEAAAHRMAAGDHFPQPDQRFRRLHLGEEQPVLHGLRVGPMVQEPPGGGGDAGIALVAPAVHLGPHPLHHLVQLAVAQMELLLAARLLVLGNADAHRRAAPFPRRFAPLRPPGVV